MPTLNIKDPDVYALAKRMAEREGVTMTAVIKEALQERDARASKEGLADWLMELGSRTAPLLAHLPQDPAADLYDEETGLPK